MFTKILFNKIVVSSYSFSLLFYGKPTSAPSLNMFFQSIIASKDPIKILSRSYSFLRAKFCYLHPFSLLSFPITKLHVIVCSANFGFFE